MIEVLRDPQFDRPLPEVDATSAVYFRGLAEGRLLVQHCPGCDRWQFYPRPFCTVCSGTPEWAEASGRGLVHTFTIIRQHGVEPYRGLTPYVVAMVELDEGPRLMGNVTGCHVDEVCIGTPVEAYAVAVNDEIGIPFWRPVTQSGGTQ